MNSNDPVYKEILDLCCTIQQIPAPTFAEEQRAQFMAERFREAGLEQVSFDSAGNVLALFPGEGSGAAAVVTAHLDTVFPLSHPLDLVRTPDRIAGPGIGDNSLGLAGLLGLIWILRQREIRLPGDLWLVANTGEEGLGNLQGMKAVVDRFGSYPVAYIVLEGMGLGEIFHRGLGVRRYRITCRTKGGHSWIDFGSPSAIHEISRLVTQITSLQVPDNPRTTYNVGVISGGTSINTVAPEASIELDLRSEQIECLDRLATQVEVLCRNASSRKVKVEASIIGDRPGGEIPANHPLVRLAKRCLQKHGQRPNLGIGSTDANVPLSRGYPAICIGLSRGAEAHTAEEYILTQPLGWGMEQLVQLVCRVWDINPRG
jgi:tripeptide aminopeptidase